jgi:hypothetical protein
MTAPLVKLLGIRHLSVLLIGTVLLCHGLFGALHLVCDPLEWCIGGAQHSAEHETAAGAGDTHGHHTGHDVSTAYFAVVALGLLVLILRLLPKCAAGLRIWLGTRWPVVLRRVPAVLRPPPTPTPPVLQVFRL